MFPSSRRKNDSDESGSEDEVPKIPQQTLELRLSGILKVLSEGKDSWKSIDQQERELLASTSNSAKKTALHLLSARSPSELPDKKRLRPLVRFLLDHKFALLNKRDSSEDCPLHLAIKSQNAVMIELIEETSHNQFVSAIDLCDSSTKNAVHLAIEHNLRENLSINIVKCASPNALYAKDKDGNTPLHLAVDYGRCGKPFCIRLCEIIIEKASKGVTDDSDFNHENRSPYLHHLHTCAHHCQSVGNSTEARTLSVEEKHPQYSTALRPGPGGPEAPVIVEVPNQSSNQLGSSSMVNGLSRTKNMKETRSQHQETLSQTRTRNGDRLAHDIDQSKPPSQNTPTGLKNMSEEIQEMLMCHYLRNRPQRNAVEILYGRKVLRNTPEKEIFLDLSSKRLSKLDGIQRTLKCLKFENMLQSVHIPLLERSKQRGTPEEIVQLFRGENLKAVKKIFKIVVDDLRSPPYSDATIRSTMTGKGVEIWDWRKVDLCPVVIFDAAPHVRVLNLYWSGNNVVLRGWSEKDGLAQLEELQSIVIHVRENSEPHESVTNNIDAFGRRLRISFVPRRVNQFLRSDRFKEVEFEVDVSLKEAIKARFGRDKKIYDPLTKSIQGVLFSKITVQTAQEMTQMLERRITISPAKSTANASRSTQSHYEDALVKKCDTFAGETIDSFPESMLAHLKDYANTYKSSRSVKDQGSKEEQKRRVEALSADLDAILGKLNRDLSLHAQEFSQHLSSFVPFIAQSNLQHVCLPNIEFEHPRKMNYLIDQGEYMGSDTSRVRQHRWIRCMEKFREPLFEALRDLEENYFENDEQVEGGGDPITVALIDDGVNIDGLEQYANFEYEIDGRSFDYIQDTHSTKPYYESSDGHGTLMARQVYRICPKVHLLVLKLGHTKGGENGKPCITPESAAQAIEYAIEKRVHIISMSWTIVAPDASSNRSPDFQLLEKAMEDAKNANILLFCSASDKGQDSRLTYPACALNECFRIGGGDDDGNPHGAVGAPVNIDYLFPGETADGFNQDTKIRQTLLTGSSIATALAAGFAALILYCAQIRLVCASDTKEKEMCATALAKLKTHKEMFKAFGNVSNQSTTKYLPVWDIFDRDFTKDDFGASSLDFVKRIPSYVCPNLYAT